MDSSNPTSTAREDRTLVKLRELYLKELRRFIKTGEPGRRGVKLIIEYTESHPVATHRPDDRRTWVWSDLHLRHANIIKYCTSLDYSGECGFGGDTGATVWYKRSVHNVLATTEAPA